MTDKINQVERLQEWVADLCEYSVALKTIKEQLDTKLGQYQQIIDDEQAVDAMVDLLFLSNRLEHMIKIWVGEGEDDD